MASRQVSLFVTGFKFPEGPVFDRNGNLFVVNVDSGDISISIYGFILVSKLKGQTSPAMEIPIAWAYLAIPVGCLLIFLEGLAMFIFKVNVPGEDRG